MTAAVTVTVETVWPGRVGSAVFTGRDDRGVLRRFVASIGRMPRPPRPGEVWAVRGALGQHPLYGLQHVVEEADLQQPSGRLLVAFLDRNPAFDGIGIGRAKAQALWNAFGERLYGVLTSGDLAELTSVLSETTARKLVSRWGCLVEETELIRFLSRYGFDARLAETLQRVWPRTALNRIQKNPYRMLAFATWARVDEAARMSLGVVDVDERRLCGAVEWVMTRWLERKHTVIPEPVAVGAVAGLLVAGPNSAASRRIAREAIDLAIQQRRVIRQSNGLQSLGVAFMEHLVAERLLCRVRSCESGNVSKTRFRILEKTIACTTRSELVPTAEQVDAIQLALTQGLAVITGGAGTGKTTVLRMIHSACEQLGVPVTQMALAGRAAHRLREIAGRQACTVAKYLIANDGPRLGLDGESLVALDEASMVDLPTFYRIMASLPTSARLLLIGDPFQLPPIGYGLIFHQLCQSAAIPRIELRKVHRQADVTGIPQVAYAIRHGIVPELQTFDGPGKGVSFLDADVPSALDAVISVADALRSDGDAQILGVTKKGPVGVRSVNSTFHAINRSDRPYLRAWELSEGAPVVFGVNDYQRNLWNGSLGSIIELSETSIRCRFDEQEFEFAPGEYRNLELAYALTVHRAQGSQFRRVIVPITPNRLLDRALIYTALTRGIEQVVLIGDREAFRSAVQAPPRGLERVVGLIV